MSFVSRRYVAGILKPLLQARVAAPRISMASRPSFVSSSISAPLRSFHISRILRDETLQTGDDVTTFKELGSRNLVADEIVRTITDDMKLVNMTPVQVQTINPCLQGHDVIAQAKTGTGKTVGFLLPVIQRILTACPELAEYRRRLPNESKMDIRAIIISPTRELAEQIAVEARKLTRKTSLKVACAVGGTQKRQHLNEMRREGCHILVGTPGRLQDILSDPDSGITAPNLDAFVLDEADRLLDQGFGPEIQDLHDQCLPRKEVKDRQTLMFSATMPREVMQTVKQLMKRNFKFVQTVSEDDVPTHEKVPQKKVEVAGLENMLPTLVELIKREITAGLENGRPFKAIVFHNSNAEVILYNEIFRTLAGRTSPSFGRARREPSSDALFPRLNVIQMHSRLTQATRTKNSAQFRQATQGVLLSSDVSARGMDFPDVTHVIQLGLPQNAESYVHRIGRTGRGDKTGEAFILLSPIDRREARSRLRAFPVENDNSLQTAKIDMTQDGQVPASAAELLNATLAAAQKAKLEDKANAYKSILGVYSFADKSTVVEQINQMSRYCWGMETPPGIDAFLARKLGISREPGLNLVSRSRNGEEGGFSSRRQLSGGGRGQGGRSFGRGGDRDAGDRFERRPSRSFERSPRDFDSSYERRPSRSFGGYESPATGRYHGRSYHD